MDAFEQLVKLAHECSYLRKECKACPHLPECVALWDHVIVNTQNWADGRLYLREGKEEDERSLSKVG